MNMMTKFGIEIECIGLSDNCSVAIETIEKHLGEESAVKFKIFDEECAWDCKGDYSVYDDSNVYCDYTNDDFDEDCGDCDGCNSITRGCEIVSPPLHYNAESIAAISEIFDALNKARAFVNHTCGLHVHVDASFIHDLKAYEQDEFFVHIQKLYATHEKSFDSRMSYCRTKSVNKFCRSMINRNDTYPTLGIQGRYYKLNIQSFLRHGTLEFRHHHGTLDKNEVIEWVKTCLLFVQYARETFQASSAQEIQISV